MKKIYFLLTVIMSVIAHGQDLIITGVVDGPLSGGTPKTVELYAINTIPNLSIYALGSANNGGGSDGEEFTFPNDTIQAGTFIYVASETAKFNEFFGFNPNYTSNPATAINGDDAIELFLNGNVTDVFGDINTDGTGQPWEYKDGWAYRNDNTTANNGTFNTANWTFSGKNALDNAETNATATTPFPLKKYGPDLIITGVIDGPLSGGTPKAIELYAKYDIADLSQYGIGSANNGGGSDGQEFTFPAEALNAGEFIYIASESTNFEAYLGFAPNYTSNAAAINGDDAIELFFNNTVIDVFGAINVDGTGQAWDYQDGWAYRLNNTGADGSTFQLDNWEYSTPNVLDNSTTNDNAVLPFPVKSYGTDKNTTITPITIAEARNTAEGELVTVTGILTVSDQFNGSAYLQDATGAIAIFDKKVHGKGVFNIGDSITVKGARSSYNQQTQIYPVFTVENNGTPNSPITPLDITLNELENHPGELVRITNVSFPNPNDALFGDSNYLLTDTSGTGELRIDADANGIAALAQPEVCNAVIGVVGKYYDLYQLLPRVRTDLDCAEPYIAPEPTVSVDKTKTLDIVTWNIEWFGHGRNSPAGDNPMSDSIQKDSVKTIIKRLNPDIIGVQEIVDDSLFNVMVSELDGYDYILSPAVSLPGGSTANKQKLGFIYKTETINPTNTEALFQSIHPLYNGGDDSAISDYPANTDRFFASGRLPFLMTANVTINGETEAYDFIVIHAKSNRGRGDEAKIVYDVRKYDVEFLKNTLDTDYADRNIVFLGDYNDDVDETVANVDTTISTFNAYVLDTLNYNVVTKTLSDQGFRSYVSRENMIDHITLSNELNDNYINETARVHYEFYDADFALTASDHFPVSISLQLKALTITDTLSTNISCNGNADGSATIKVAGGIAPYNYLWSNDSITSTLTNLSAGAYNVTVTDAVGSKVSTSFNIEEPTAITYTTPEETTVYYGAPNNACATLQVSNLEGGVAPYTYQWSNGETTAEIVACPEKTTTYTVTVTDANKCSVTKTTVVNVIDVSCGKNNNKVQVCHKGKKTICISKQKLQDHLNHGDTLGTCNDSINRPVSKFKVFPNPFASNLNVVVKTNYSTPATFVMYNCFGTIVFKKEEELIAGKNKFTYNLENLNTGIYYTKLLIDNKVEKTQKVVKF